MKSHESGKLNTNSKIKISEKFVEELNQRNEGYGTRMEGMQRTNIFKKTTKNNARRG